MSRESGSNQNPADYPYSIHIWNQEETTWYRNHHAEESRGEGRADLFANGQVHGVDFSFACEQKLKAYREVCDALSMRIRRRFSRAGAASG